MIGPRTLSHTSIIAAIHAAVQEGNEKAIAKTLAQDHSAGLDVGSDKRNQGTEEAGAHPEGGSIGR